MLIRLAIDKFFKTKEKETYLEAIQLAFEDYFLPYFEGFNSNDWRRKYLWREEIDLVCSRFEDKL